MPVDKSQTPTIMLIRIKAPLHKVNEILDFLKVIDSPPISVYVDSIRYLYADQPVTVKGTNTNSVVGYPE